MKPPGFKQSKPYLDLICSHFTGAAGLSQSFFPMPGPCADSSVSNQTPGPYVVSLVSEFCTKTHLLILSDGSYLRLGSHHRFCFIFLTLGKDVPAFYTPRTQTEKMGP